MEDTPLSWPVTKRITEVPVVGINIEVLSSAIPKWANGVAEYLDKGKPPEAREEAKRLKRKATRFLLIEGIIYKREFLTPLLHCISGEEAKYVLAEIHEAICRNHLGGKTLTQKALQAGYYWPNPLRDSSEFIKKCIKCQLHALVSHIPPEELISIMAPWPFTQWGVDLVGHFPSG